MVRRIQRPQRQAPEGKGKYVYCVIRSAQDKKSFGNIGFDGEEVYIFDYRDLSPIVSDVPFKEYGVDEQYVESHRRVVEEIMKENTVLPVAYGMAFKNRKLLQIAMGAGYAAMQKAIEVIDGKVELGVKVFLPKECNSWSEAKKEDCRMDFFQDLRTAASDSKELKLFSDRLILNSAFLVNKDGIVEFSDKVSQLSELYDEAKVQYSGPWPAYNFVDIHILGKKRKGFR